ncbi:hypothetical protein Tco_0381467 [Tanacetum coccineum]
MDKGLFCTNRGQISSRTGKMVGSDGLGHGYNTASTNGTSQATTTNVLDEASQRAKPTAARGGTNTLGNHKLLHPFRNSRWVTQMADGLKSVSHGLRANKKIAMNQLVVVCGSSVITELVKVATSSISETQLENHNWRHTKSNMLNWELRTL